MRRVFLGMIVRSQFELQRRRCRCLHADIESVVIPLRQLPDEHCVAVDIDCRGLVGIETQVLQVRQRAVLDLQRALPHACRTATPGYTQSQVRRLRRARETVLSAQRIISHRSGCLKLHILCDIQHNADTLFKGGLPCPDM